MITPEDIRNLIKAFKEVFATKEELAELRDEFRVLASSVDNYGKRADVYYQEMLVLNHRVNRHENWIQILAKKLGINLDF